jgi:isocitrate dehydrogenase (NAD+)
VVRRSLLTGDALGRQLKEAVQERSLVRGSASPTALMLSSVMLLIHLGETNAANKLQSAVESVYREGKYLTGDVGGSATSEEFTDAVVRALKG